MVMVKLENLLEEGEQVAEYALTNNYPTYNCIAPEGDVSRVDIGACLEDTLHRILESGGTSGDVQEIMGARIPTGEERKELEEFGEYTEIDLGYVLPGLLLYFR